MNILFRHFILTTTKRVIIHWTKREENSNQRQTNNDLMTMKCVQM